MAPNGYRLASVAPVPLVALAVMLALASSIPVHAQTVDRTVCQTVWLPASNNHFENDGQWGQVCDSVSSPPVAAEPASPPEPEFSRRGPGTQDTVLYYPKANSGEGHHGPIVSEFCPKPYRMTEKDGCQMPARR